MIVITDNLKSRDLYNKFSAIIKKCIEHNFDGFICRSKDFTDPNNDLEVIYYSKVGVSIIL